MNTSSTASTIARPVLSSYREAAALFDRIAYGRALVATMNRRHQSYRQVARAIDVSPSKLCRIGRGKSIPDVETYLRINAWLADGFAIHLAEQDTVSEFPGPTAIVRFPAAEHGVNA
jgi:transcriptional regulator with XRE-family HTH domain